MRVLTSPAKAPGEAVVPADSPVSVRVAAYGAAHATQAELPNLRQRVGPVNGPPLAAAFLRHQDDQTIVGLAAVFAALDGALRPEELHTWGVVGAPRFLGRTTMSTALPKFLAEGAWGVSPHTIPYFSLHSVAGAVSQALHIQGPNFGAGGGPGNEVEGLLAAMAMLSGHHLPGVLLVITGWEPELVPNAEASAVDPPICRAIALALTPPGEQRHGLRLSFVLPGQEKAGFSKKPGFCKKPGSCRLQSLAALLSDSHFAAVHWPFAGGGMLAWQRIGAEGSRE